MTSKKNYANYVRNFVFGVEDSLVSTVGLLSGIASANVPKQTIFATGLVLIFVEAFSMGAGSFLSEKTTEEYLDDNYKTKSRANKDSFIMFISYFTSGFIPLFPYLVYEPLSAFWISISVTLVSLFILGVISAKLLKTNLLKSAIRMLIVGGIAVTLGVTVGKLIKFI